MKSLLNPTFLALVLMAFYNLKAQQMLTKHPSNNRYPNWSPDGSKIVFESDRNGSWDIYLINLMDSSLSQVTHHNGNERWPSWHPNGKEIIFSSDREGIFKIYLLKIEVKSEEKVAVYDLDDALLFPRISPDGEIIAFNYRRNIYTVNIDGGETKQLTQDSTRSLYPVWSPTGDLAFFSRRDTEGQTDEIYSLEAKTNQIDRLTTHPTHNFVPSWSPNDGYLVCATSMPDSRPELFLISQQDKTLKRITFNDFGDTEPSWSPTSNSVAYACQKNGTYDICLLSLDKLIKE